MIYFEHHYGAQPTYAPGFGSACVWHDDPAAADRPRNPADTWSDPELEAMMNGRCLGLADVESAIRRCASGHKFAGADYALPLSDFGVPSKALLIEYDDEAAHFTHPG